jgi:hypothetical protein
MVYVPRSQRHHGSTGKTLLPTLMVGARTSKGVIEQVRRKKKYPRRYYAGGTWYRRDELIVLGRANE